MTPLFDPKALIRIAEESEWANDDDKRLIGEICEMIKPGSEIPSLFQRGAGFVARVQSMIARNVGWQHFSPLRKLGIDDAQWIPWGSNFQISPSYRALVPGLVLCVHGFCASLPGTKESTDGVGSFRIRFAPFLVVSNIPARIQISRARCAVPLTALDALDAWREHFRAYVLLDRARSHHPWARERIEFSAWVRRIAERLSESIRIEKDGSSVSRATA